MEIHDYIVIGAGSAGCPLARALSDDPNVSVLVLEAGPHADRFWVDTPAGMARLFFDKVRNWNYFTEPMPKLKGRRMYWPRGKMLGGSSSMNGMIFIRGHRNDFDSWRDLGCPGWGYDDVLPLLQVDGAFRASRRHMARAGWSALGQRPVGEDAVELRFHRGASVPLMRVPAK